MPLPMWAIANSIPPSSCKPILFRASHRRPKHRPVPPASIPRRTNPPLCRRRRQSNPPRTGTRIAPVDRRPAPPGRQSLCRPSRQSIPSRGVCKSSRSGATADHCALPRGRPPIGRARDMWCNRNVLNSVVLTRVCDGENYRKAREDRGEGRRNSCTGNSGRLATVQRLSFQWRRPSPKRGVDTRTR